MPNKRTYVHHDFDMSYEEIKKGWKMPYSHLHSHYEIYILLSGERIVTIGDDSFHVSAGDATLFPRETPHQSRGETDFSGICIHFSPVFLSRYFKADAVKSLMECFRHPVISLPEACLQKLYETTTRFDWRAQDNYLTLACILSGLNQACHARSDAAPDAAGAEGLPARILQYLDGQYAVVDTLAEISAALGVSESYVHRCVKKLTGMTPKQYINHLRVRNAMRDLEYGNRNLSVIQELCGFHSASYFFRVFKQETGMTPTEYRRRQKTSSAKQEDETG